MRVTVTRDHLRDRSRISPLSLAVADALVGAGIERPRVQTLWWHVLVYTAGRHHHVPLPSAAHDWLRRYDHGAPVGSLTIDVPELDTLAEHPSLAGREGDHAAAHPA